MVNLHVSVILALLERCANVIFVHNFVTGMVCAKRMECVSVRQGMVVWVVILNFTNVTRTATTTEYARSIRVKTHNTCRKIIIAKARPYSDEVSRQDGVRTIKQALGDQVVNPSSCPAGHLHESCAPLVGGGLVLLHPAARPPPLAGDMVASHAGIILANNNK